MSSKGPGKLGIVTLVVVIAAVALYYSQERKTSEKFAPHDLFPDLTLDDVVEIEISDEQETFLLQSAGDSWGLEARGGYPIQDERLRKLVFAVANLRAADRVTKNPENYDALGLDSEFPETGRLRFLDKGGAELVNLIIGQDRQKPSSDPLASRFGPPDGQFVRVEGDEWVYLIDQALSLNASPSTWLVRDIVKLKEDSLRQIKIDNRGTTDSFVLERTGADSFEITTTIPAGFKPKTYAVSSIGRALSNFTLDDVMKADDPDAANIDFDATYTAVQKNGVAYAVQVGQNEDRRYAKISVEYIESMDLAKSDERTSDSVAAKELELADVTVKKAGEKHAGWVYKISTYQYDNLSKTLSDLLEEAPEEEEEEDEPAPDTEPAVEDADSGDSEDDDSPEAEDTEEESQTDDAESPDAENAEEEGQTEDADSPEAEAVAEESQTEDVNSPEAENAEEEGGGEDDGDDDGAQDDDGDQDEPSPTSP